MEKIFYVQQSHIIKSNQVHRNLLNPQLQNHEQRNFRMAIAALITCNRAPETPDTH